MIQFAATVFPAWELPGWSLRLIIGLVLVGFPIALILAWAFDMTPAGLQAEPETAGEPRERTAIRRRGDLVLLGGFGVRTESRTTSTPTWRKSAS